MKPAKRIGLFGGSFDPVHNAHVALARLALDRLQLDELRWIPAGKPWQKKDREITPASQREAMVALAIQGEPRFKLERCELERSGPSYMLDTVRDLQAAESGAQWFLIVGQDQYASLHTWHGWQELLRLVRLAVANRPGAHSPVNAELARVPHVEVALPMMDVSSTELRQRIAAGQGVDDLVPAAVARYIDQHHLYSGPPGS